MNREKGEGPDGDYKNLISFVTDRPGPDYRYAVDASKIKRELGWEPSEEVDMLLTRTVPGSRQKYRRESWCVNRRWDRSEISIQKNSESRSRQLNWPMRSDRTD